MCFSFHRCCPKHFWQKKKILTCTECNLEKPFPNSISLSDDLTATRTNTVLMYGRAVDMFVIAQTRVPCILSVPIPLIARLVHVPNVVTFVMLLARHKSCTLCCNIKKTRIKVLNDSLSIKTPTAKSFADPAS